MVMPNPDDEWEDFDDEDDISPLNTASMSISAAGGSGNDPGLDWAYSAINAREAKVAFEAMYDFVRNYRPDEKMGRTIIDDLLELARKEWMSPACRRRLRFEEQEQKASYWLTRLGKDNEPEQERTEEILRRWARANLVQIEIQGRRIAEGLSAVEGERARWYTAERNKSRAERDATTLHPSAYEVFKARVEQHTIQREEAKDRAMQYPQRDYSELIKRINSGQATPAEVVTAAPWAFEKAVKLALANAGEDNPYWKHIERLQAGAAAGFNGRRRRSRPRRRDDYEDAE